MEHRTIDFNVEAFVDPSSVQDVVRGILHTIFFHRFFPSVMPRTRNVLDLTLPYIDDNELETLIDQRTQMLVRQLEEEKSASINDGSHGGGNSRGGRGQISVQFFEKRRRKAWYVMRGEEEVCWESWTVKVTVAEPRTESERAKVRQAMESTLLAAVMKIVTSVNANKDHIPPITTSESNPFPYQINVNQKEAGWAARMGIY
ncbi:uncharacterized protein SPSK_03603 [Sporothrix schenckii 1099-18]|uniref:Autophagy-related protein 101 n=2 Tax=Sporothrix schenckii TaxID=29908 RepID=U7PQ79_SPOS1|nr:uncharacterized protein SPSK_03603 [Sporothrix schenckii 1099-18]ERS97752.1 hypothetical protein HMPREF1624_05923 [Sporothrix schenckii ATCC 58251]KJR82298.1 hypothetical protein SPSK_03603 [Sporothrix schenckii 1099-18]